MMQRKLTDGQKIGVLLSLLISFNAGIMFGLIQEPWIIMVAVCGIPILVGLISLVYIVVNEL